MLLRRNISTKIRHISAPKRGGLPKIWSARRNGLRLFLLPAFGGIDEGLVDDDAVLHAGEICIDPLVGHASLFVLGAHLIGIGQHVLVFLDLLLSHLDRAFDAS